MADEQSARQENIGKCKPDERKKLPLQEVVGWAVHADSLMANFIQGGAQNLALQTQIELSFDERQVSRQSRGKQSDVMFQPPWVGAVDA